MDNWLINLLALVLFAVVLDGARRAYLKHRDTMKVSRNLSRSMRRDLGDDYDDGILSRPRSVEPPEQAARKPQQPAAAVSAVGPESTDVPQASASFTVEKKPSLLTDSELELIDPEEAEKRRQIAAELPGTVRVVQRRKPEDASQVNRQVQQNFHSSRKPLAGSKPERRDTDPVDAPVGKAAPVEPAQASVPEQVSLNLEEQVPMLMDSVADAEVEPADEWPPAEASAVATASAETRNPDPVAGLADEPILADRREPSLDESVSLESLQQVSAQDDSEQWREAADEVGGKAGVVAAAAEKARALKPGWASAEIKLPELKFPELKKGPAQDSRAPQDAPAKGRNSGRNGKRGSDARSERPVEEVLILNIMAPKGDYFEGNDLLRVLLSSGLRFGDMNIFHYHCGEAGEGPVLFSLANIVVPGTFDMSDMEDFTTPGVSLFLALPAEVEALKAFDTLLTTARTVSEQLGGELKDENRSVFTAQTAEHYRQRVMEFQRRKALAKAQA
ncbi:cell division protein ZipA [Microbulbifer sp. CAU 1566]|uniref:cell division protein ZipA n=1 Tax=Microbulbifer sp. CAU 1566 TaxID=2933269 RepID=UPI002003ED4E|nr:cell division protein ZipA [Microbulbifer sp. CAU 1566]MCK7597494.1 cell division protein ZipA [Microbulbifer sp. CAU 1566]